MTLTASPDKLQGVIDAGKRNLQHRMTDELLAEQKAHLVMNSSRQQKKQSQKKNLTNMMNQYTDSSAKQFKVAKAAIDIKRFLLVLQRKYMMEEIWNEDWASYIKTAADLNNQLSAAVELLKDTECNSK